MRALSREVAATNALQGYILHVRNGWPGRPCVTEMQQNLIIFIILQLSAGSNVGCRTSTAPGLARGVEGKSMQSVASQGWLGKQGDKIGKSARCYLSGSGIFITTHKLVKQKYLGKEMDCPLGW